MITKRTVIGTVIGGAIIAVGLYSLITSLGIQEVAIDEQFGPGKQTEYTLTAPAGQTQSVLVFAASFESQLLAPGMQKQVAEHKGSASFEWTHEQEGTSFLRLKNTGPGDMTVGGTARIVTDPIYTAYHAMVMISGVIIIGFSAGFSVRKPRGF